MRATPAASAVFVSPKDMYFAEEDHAASASVSVSRITPVDFCTQTLISSAATVISLSASAGTTILYSLFPFSTILRLVFLMLKTCVPPVYGTSPSETSIVSTGCALLLQPTSEKAMMRQQRTAVIFQIFIYLPSLIVRL